MTESSVPISASKENVLIEQNKSQVPETGSFVAEDTAMHLFQIAALMLGDEQAAVTLVEETLERMEADPCSGGTLAYTEARALLAQTAVQRMAGLFPDGFSVPALPVSAGCIDTDDLGEAGLTGEQINVLLADRAGRAGMRNWLGQLTPALRAIFVLRAVAGQDGEQTAQNLRQSGATGAPAWRRDQVGIAYRQALCSLASCLVSSRGELMPA